MGVGLGHAHLGGRTALPDHAGQGAEAAADIGHPARVEAGDVVGVGSPVGEGAVVLLDEEPVEEPYGMGIEARDPLVHDVGVALTLIPGGVHQRPDFFQGEGLIVAEEGLQVLEVRFGER